jgi:uncharacterized protein (TIGR01244 family)
VIFLSSCTGSKIKTDVKITDKLYANKFADIYFTAQPSEQDLMALKKIGVKTIVNLRKNIEKDYKESNEENLVKKLNLTYVHIPVDLKLLSQPVKIDQITYAIMEHRKKGPVLIHCSSGNRSAYWAGIHFFKDHGYSRKNSYKTAVALGLDDEEVGKTLKETLKQMPSNFR